MRFANYSQDSLYLPPEMKGFIHSRPVRNGMTMLGIAIFIFGYVNSAMFMHSHKVDGRTVVHSHISGKDHRAGHSTGGHTAAQFLLLDIVNHAVYTDAAVPFFDLHPVRLLERILPALAETVSAVAEHRHPSLRAPPIVD